MPLTRTFLSTLAVVCLFTACKKEDLSDKHDKRLQRIVSDKDSLLSTTFRYDTRNRLIELTDSNRQGHIWGTSIEYDVAGNPVKFITLHHYQSNSVDNKTEDSLVYVDNRVVKKLYKSASSIAFKLINSYSYNANGMLITDTAYSYWSDNKLGYTQFTYDSNDDIIQYQFFNNSSGVMDNVGNAKVSYNAVINPYNAIDVPLYFVTDDYLLLGKHNKTKVILDWQGSEQSTTEYAYEYDSDGLPKSMVRTRSYGGQQSGVSTISLYYQ